jgi:hypothetical protein
MFQTSVPLSDKNVPQNSGRINVQDDLEYWCRRFGVTPTRLLAAVEKVGDVARKVETELKRR